MTMATGDSSKSTVSDLARRLETETIGLLNKTAKEYLASVNQYLANVSITVPRPSDAIFIDRSIGIAWVVLIPVLYFVTVGLILGALLCFFWYSEKTGSDSSRDSDTPSVFEPINNDGQDRVINNAPLPGVFVRSYLTSAGEFTASPRSSVASKGSTRSLGVLTGQDLDFQPESRNSCRNPGSTAQTRRLSKSIPELQEDGDHSGQMNKSNGSRQLRKPDKPMLKTIELLATCSNSLSSESLEDNISRDSLRASMESHKLVWMAHGNIKSDDMYNISISSSTSQCNNKSDGNMNYIPNFNIDSDNIFTKKDTGRKLQHVFENPVVTDEKVYLHEVDSHLKKSYEESLSAEKTQNKYNVIYHKEKNTRPPLIKSDIIHSNSSDSVATNLPVSILLCHPVSETTYHSDLERSKNLGPKTQLAPEEIKAKRCLFSTNIGTNVHEIPFPILHAKTQDKQSSQLSLHSNNNIEAVSQLGSHIYEKDLASNHVAMNGSGAPQYRTDTHNFEVSSSSQITTASSQEFEQIGLSQDSSDDEQDDSCVNISLPSSISRFHASKVGTHPTPTAGYPLASTQNYTPGLIQQASQDSQLDSQNEDNNIDSFSVCPNVGSYSQSIAPLSCTFGSSQNSLEFLQDDKIHSSKRNNSKDSIGNAKTCLFSKFEAGDELMSKSNVSEGVVKRTGESKDDQLPASPRPEPKPRERFSLDFLGNGKVSVEQRLKEFGFIKTKGKNKYVINPSPGKFAGRRGHSDHRAWSEDSNRWSLNSTQSNEKEYSNKQNHNESFGKSDKGTVRPHITEVLNASSNSFYVRSNLEDMSLWQQNQLEQKKKDHKVRRNETQNDQRRVSDYNIDLYNDKGKNDSLFFLHNATRTIYKEGADNVTMNESQDHRHISTSVPEKESLTAGKGFSSYEKGEFSDSAIFDWAMQRDKPQKSVPLTTNVLLEENKESKRSANRLGVASKTSMTPIRRTNTSSAKDKKINRQRSKKSLVFGGFHLGFVGEKAVGNFKQYSNNDFLSVTSVTEPLVTKETDPLSNDRSRHSFVNASYEDLSGENDKNRHTESPNEYDNRKNASKENQPTAIKMNALPLTRKFSDEANTTSKLYQFGQNRVSSIDLFAKICSESRDSDFFVRHHPSLMTPSTPESKERGRRKTEL